MAEERLRLPLLTSGQEEVTINLKDTLFIPEFPVNVMSVLRLYKSGDWVDGNELYDSTGDLFGQLYIGGDRLHISTRETTVHRRQQEPQNFTMSSMQCLDTDLWHRRLGHVNPYQVPQTTKITKALFAASATIRNPSISAIPATSQRP